MLGNHCGVCLANLHDWDCIAQTWPAIVHSGHSSAMSLEKPSIVRLFDDLADKVHRQYETIGIDFTVSSVACFVHFVHKLWSNVVSFRLLKCGYIYHCLVTIHKRNPVILIGIQVFWNFPTGSNCSMDLVHYPIESCLI